ncbi:MAG: hypothetical protein RLY31_605 [Bacteroidota bacterium]
MNTSSPSAWEDQDPTAADRKRDHIDLAFRSQVLRTETDPRFSYEPMLAAHPIPGSLRPFSFLNKTMRVPIWVSSMTGGTQWARTINQNLAQACRDFGMGMGLGSCRSLLHSDESMPDFDVRDLLGPDQPLYANLGVAQVERLLERDETWRIRSLVDRLRADGLILHVNPLQEWLQPEGDRFAVPPLETITTLLARTDIPLIVKEVGQGMGIDSLKALFRLPLQAIDFAAAGGTNFAKLELLRSDPSRQAVYESLARVGHTAPDMVGLATAALQELGDEVRCHQVIISGGVRDFLDGYYLINKLPLACVYGQAAPFLQHARGTYQALHDHVAAQVSGLELATALLRVR